ncbi:hypothetical protein OVA03_06940 [Asticcacaulis sp. SL142]|jgi:ABC-type transport system involved in cytochrome c biogenesis permease subunit|uniref:hypothetical protein n=1 Tax=Asticcacaulis sp. SL142 TaxID=2995155 RepID=UPI00226CE9C1|nr:hypothetical protein [Asticcacaulis sp. SL142]WAC49631.1 hypothetical protein OVA03_06940 [Asticcacaulis sp. SL142]
MSIMSPFQNEASTERRDHSWLGWVFLVSWVVVIALTVIVHKSSTDIVHTYALPVIAGSLWMSVYLLFLTPELNAE